MAQRTEYEIETTHPSYPRNQGTFRVEVTANPDGTRYVKGSPFGCSRDYHTTSDKSAIEQLLHEHGTQLETCRKIS